MPTYLGPFDVVVIDGKEYQRGQNVNVSAERLNQLRSASRYVFAGDDQSSVAPIMSNAPTEVHPPNEFGVPEPLKSQAEPLKARAEGDAVPVLSPAPQS